MKSRHWIVGCLWLVLALICGPFVAAWSGGNDDSTVRLVGETSPPLKPAGLGLVPAELVPIELTPIDLTLGKTASRDDSDPIAPASDEWIQLFNGKDLTGWTPKIRYSPLGENYGETFQVSDGVLKVVYDPKFYPKFEERFGHLFYEKSFSHYRLRAEYRFVGEQVAGGPGWAVRNNGLMLHCQDPKTMRVDQDFPASIEVQLLGGDGQNERTTANLCTPGTNVVLNGKLFLPHCTNSKSKTYHGQQWVTVEVEVLGGTTIKHIMDGEVVLEYSEPQLDPRDADAKKLIDGRNGELILTEGFISIQAESAPIEFRKIEILPLQPEPQTPR